MKGVRIFCAVCFGLAAVLWFLMAGFEFAAQDAGGGIFKTVIGFLNLLCAIMWTWMAARYD